MKIAIIGLPRSGTTSLYFFIKDLLPKYYLCDNEPWSKTKDVEITENCFYKTLISDNLHLNKNESLTEYGIRMINTFNKIIFLRRKDANEMKKSLADMLVRRYKEYEYCKNLAEKYLDEWIPIFNTLTENKKIYYYEDLYTNNISKDLLDICKYLEIDFDEKIYNKWIHIKNKQIEEKVNRTLL